MRQPRRTARGRAGACGLLVAAALSAAACQSSSGGAGEVPSGGAGDSATTTVDPATSPDPVFFDDFLGTSLDPAKWTVLDRLSDQANDEVNCVAPQNVSVRDGLLEIVSRFEDRSCGDTLEPAGIQHYTSGQVQQATPPFLYGTVDVRAKAPGGVGTWPAIWMLGFEWQASQPFTANVEGHQWPKAGWSEIDIAEFWQGKRDVVNTTVHFNRTGGLHLQPLPFDATTRFMVYRLQWAPGSLVWSVDAEDGRGFRQLYSVKGSGRVPNVPMYVVIHTAVGGTGGGKPDPSTFPQTLTVDYVRVTR